ncbi:MAG: hypothetical protein AM325_003585 [Candidatus Thorarchaeota archaeon SMTZ1-45]|nr:MAG: hypothetical protein AM325_05360 [Candidatus Thorarchaeota archaeon SMTZ1-45]
METQTKYTSPYKQIFDEVESLSAGKLILGLAASTLIMLASTWGLLSLLNFSGVYSFDTSRFIPYTMYMLAASAGSIILAVLLCGIIVKWPRTVSLPLLIHRRAKHHTGDYYLSPEPDDENLGTVFRRSLYGSVLIVGIALTLLGFELMVELDTGGLIFIGTWLMVASVAILPFTIMLLYFGPWLMKDSGLFHLDTRDRSLSNVGDDVEDILEFFAGVDIILVWLELTMNVGLEAPWVPIFIIIVPLGPLFSIVLNFTLVFMAFKERATLSMMRYLTTKFDVPDMVNSPNYIRSQVLALVDRELLMVDQAPSMSLESQVEEEDKLEVETVSELELEEPPAPIHEHIPPPPDDEKPIRGDHIPPPPGDFTESPTEDDD